MTQEEFLQRIKEIFDECYTIVERKNKDYSGEDALSNFFKCEELGICDAEVGLLVRCGDKLSRIANIIKSKNQHVKDESVRDTILDLINYLAILLVVLEYKQNIKR